jgi:hypothetical protein
MTLIGKLLREPLVHFLVLGAGLFLLYGLVADYEPERVDLIVIDEQEISRLSEQFQRTWMRPPQPRELRGLVDDLVKEEILYREALALGLDQDDLVVRRRMRQKMEFLEADLVEHKQPTDAELQVYLDSHAEQFALPDRYSFRQVFFSPELSGDDPETRANRLLARLRTDPSLADASQSLGDATLLPPSVWLDSRPEIASVFGAELADAVMHAELNAWSGPYRSAYGWHLVHLIAREKGGLPPFEQLRPRVEREWFNQRRQEANERFYQALRQRYSIEIRLPDSALDADKLTARGQ